LTSRFSWLLRSCAWLSMLYNASMRLCSTLLTTTYMTAWRTFSPVSCPNKHWNPPLHHPISHPPI
jgi:hypothetical protein